jgi:hypothetical protein
MTIVLLFIAPLLYWLPGAAFLLGRKDGGLFLAPLLGGAIAGLAAEFAYAVKWSVPATTLSVLAITALLTLARLYRETSARVALGSLGELYGFYLLALVPALLSPFPIAGTWDGDWLFLYEAGQSLWKGTDLTAESLQRPPLFGGGASFLWLFQGGLIPFQIYAAVMSAGTIGACVFALRRHGCHITLRRLLPLLVLTPFFLHHTAACWGKLMAAGLLVASGAELASNKSRPAEWWSALWFALAVAVHQSSLLYAPLLLGIRLLPPHRNTAPALLKWLTRMAIPGILLVGSFEGWTVFHYGLEAKIAANPSVAQRDPALSLLENTAMVILTSFVGWSPLESLLRWLEQADAFTLARAGKEGFWLLTSWVQVMAGTFLGVWGPVLLASRFRRGDILTEKHSTKSLWIPGSSAAVVVVLNGLLTPFASSHGTMQAGLVGLGLAGLLIFIAAMEAVCPSRHRAALILTTVFGFLPWLLLNAGISAGSHLSASFRDMFLNGSEGDWKRIVANDLTPLGLSHPALQLFCVAALAFYLLFQMKRHPLTIT